MQVKGVAIEVSQIEKGQGRNGEWQRMGIVVEYDDNGYKKNLAVDFMNKKVEFASKVRKGDNVTIEFNVESRKSNGGKWYTSAQGWRVNVDRPAAGTKADDDLPY